MRKVILMILLVVASSNAVAEWVKVTSISDSGLTVYADPTTISKSGDTVAMSSMYDFKAAQMEEGFEPYVSARFQVEYDCKEKQKRVIEFNNYSKNMGNGEVVFSYNDTDKWTPVELNSVSEPLWKSACGK